MLAMGDTELLRGTPRQSLAAARELAGEMDTDGMLVVHAPDPEAARNALEMSLGGVAKEWRIAEPVRSAGGMYRLEAVLRLRGSGDPVELVAELEERWTGQIAAAEYTPFRHRPDDDDDDDDDD